jgi:hypothetical protein
MAQAEQRNLAYLFRLRTTKNVSRALQRAMAQSDWSDAGQGWQGKETRLRLDGWSRQRRVILLRRQLKRPLAIVDHGDPAQPRLGFAEVGPDRQVWEYAALVTLLDREILTLGQAYRDRADCENPFDELKNHWGWGGFTTQDLKRCRLLARSVALIYNWWSLFVCLADPQHHREAITSRPLLLTALARRTHHAGLLSEADPPWRPAPLPTRWRFPASCSGSNAEGMADSRDFVADIAQPDDAEHLAVELRADCGLPAAIPDGAGFLNEVTRATEDERPG